MESVAVKEENFASLFRFLQTSASAIWYIWARRNTVPRQIKVTAPVVTTTNSSALAWCSTTSKQIIVLYFSVSPLISRATKPCTCFTNCKNSGSLPTMVSGSQSLLLSNSSHSLQCKWRSVCNNKKMPLTVCELSYFIHNYKG